MNIFLKIFWKTAYFFYPYIRDLSLFLRLVKHGGRQQYRIGFLRDGVGYGDFEKFLVEIGFEPAVIAWIDDDEVFGMRKLDGKLWQYHVRLYKDGEVRGHKEYSPESWRWWKHFTEVDEETGEEYFKEKFGGMLKITEV